MSIEMNVYPIANKFEFEPFKAGYQCAKAAKEGNYKKFINPYEPDTFDGQQFSEGVYSFKQEGISNEYSNRKN